MGSMKEMSHLSIVGATVLFALLTGCGMVGLSGKESVPHFDNARFMDLWHVYSQCQAESDVKKLHDESSRLSRAAQSHSHSAGFVLPLPEKIERWVALPPTRLAVDVKAMAMACTIRTGQVAQQVGRNDMAQEMFRAVLSNEDDPTYEYYRAQARNGLAEVEIGLQASLPRR